MILVLGFHRAKPILVFGPSANRQSANKTVNITQPPQTKFSHPRGITPTSSCNSSLQTAKLLHRGIPSKLHPADVGRPQHYPTCRYAHWTTIGLIHRYPIMVFCMSQRPGQAIQITISLKRPQDLTLICDAIGQHFPGLDINPLSEPHKRPALPSIYLV